MKNKILFFIIMILVLNLNIIFAEETENITNVTIKYLDSFTEQSLFPEESFIFEGPIEEAYSFYKFGYKRSNGMGFFAVERTVPEIYENEKYGYGDLIIYVDIIEILDGPIEDEPGNHMNHQANQHTDIVDIVGNSAEYGPPVTIYIEYINVFDSLYLNDTYKNFEAKAFLGQLWMFPTKSGKDLSMQFKKEEFQTAITWTSSDESIATIDNNGTITPIAPGEVIITAKISPNDDEYINFLGNLFKAEQVDIDDFNLPYQKSVSHTLKILPLKLENNNPVIIEEIKKVEEVIQKDDEPAIIKKEQEEDLLGNIIEKHITVNGDVLEVLEINNLPLGTYEIYAKEFEGYELKTTIATQMVELTKENIQEVVIVEYEYIPLATSIAEEPTNIVIPVIAGLGAVALIIILNRKHLAIYKVEEDGKVLLLKKKRIKFSKADIEIELANEFKQADGNKLRVKFFRNATRKLSEKTIRFLDKGKLVKIEKLPLLINKEFEVTIEL